MQASRRRIRQVRFLLIITALMAVLVGAATGYFLAETRNIQNSLNIGEYTPALPSLILDRRGKLISQFFAEEKREIVALSELPSHLIYALIAKEDRSFYTHNGFSLRGFLRAAWNILNDNYFSGGSTISQQVAGTLYENREIETIGRKLKELFWSIQLEKRRTKDEILEMYFNFSSFGHGTFGVEAAAQFYFGHSAREVTVAESAMLVTQLARINSMFRNPNRARIVQKATLDAMVKMGFASASDVERSYDEFWRDYESTRSNLSSAYTETYDKAPYFSELVRKQFETTFYGASDLYRDGYTIHTTLDLAYQRAAEAEMAAMRDSLNTGHRQTLDRALDDARSRILPATEVIALLFGIPELNVVKAERRREASVVFDNVLLDSLDAVSLVTGGRLMHELLSRRKAQLAGDEPQGYVDGALVTVDNETGHILAMVSGSETDFLEVNLATENEPYLGSAITPLYAWKSLESAQAMPATFFYDSPSVFLSDLYPPVVPKNLLDSWNGPVSFRDAISRSINIPSLKILESIGLENGITALAAVFGDSDQAADRIRYPRSYDVGLGEFGASPLNVALAYTVFPRLGRAIVPLFITHIEDRYGEIIYNYEQEALQLLARKRDVMTPQSAYLITDMLTSTLKDGTLNRQAAEIGGFGEMPMAAKTGITVSGGDAWTVGYSPFVTTAVWFGFREAQGRFGEHETGASSSGAAWSGYMKTIHDDLPTRGFSRPESRLIDRQVCAVSGLLPTEVCTDGIRSETFLAGTEPTELCAFHPKRLEREQELLHRLRERVRLLSPNLSRFIEPVEPLEPYTVQ